MTNIVDGRGGKYLQSQGHSQGQDYHPRSRSYQVTLRLSQGHILGQGQ